MECFAAFLSYTDAQIGRLLDFVDDLGDADRTMVVLVSDNGASSEGGKDGTINEGRLSNFEGSPVDEMLRRIDEIGGPLSHNNYPWGWTMAGNTPFKRWKREVHEGGVADPCIVRLPADRRSGPGGGVRRQFAHAVDIVPTVLELVGVDAPREIDGTAQSHLDGTSFAYVFGPGGEGEPGRHVTQHFEMLGSRAIYHDGWKAVAYHPVGPIYDDGLSANAPFGDDVWELYHVAEDASEAHDLAAEHPEKVAELVALWWDEARRNDVLPLDNRVLEAMAHKNDRRRPRDTFRYFQDGAPVPEWVAADVRNRSHTVTVTVDVADGTVPSGTLLALGCALGGWSLHVLDGRASLRPQSARPEAVRSRRRLAARRRPPCGRVPLRQGPRCGGPGDALVGRRQRRHRECRPFHPGRLQRGRDRADLRLRVGTLGRGRLRGAVPLQRHHRARRGDGHRPGRPRPRGRGGRHPVVAVTRPATVVDGFGPPRLNL